MPPFVWSGDTAMETRMFSFLKVVVGAGAVFPALGAGMFYSLYAGWFKSDLLKSLPRESIYNLFLYSLGSAVFCFVLLVVLQACSGKGSAVAKAGRGGIAVTSTGSGNVNVNSKP